MKNDVDDRHRSGKTLLVEHKATVQPDRGIAAAADGVERQAGAGPAAMARPSPFASCFSILPSIRNATCLSYWMYWPRCCRAATRSLFLLGNQQIPIYVGSGVFLAARAGIGHGVYTLSIFNPAIRLQESAPPYDPPSGGVFHWAASTELLAATVNSGMGGPDLNLPLVTVTNVRRCFTLGSNVFHFQCIGGFK